MCPHEPLPPGSSARVTEESPSYGGSSAVASTAAAAAAREAAPKGIFSLLLGTGGSAEAAGGAAVEVVEDAVPDAADIAADLEDAKCECGRGVLLGWLTAKVSWWPLHPVTFKSDTHVRRKHA